MRFVGRISDWNDDKGYGFATPHDGGARAFVHIKAFQPGSRRPVTGDLISYEATQDQKGRNNAVNVRFAGQRIAEPKPRPARSGGLRNIPRRTLAVVALLGVTAAAAAGWVPVLVPVLYGLLSLASFLAYWRDKDAANAKAWRTPEGTLHLLDLFGGWPGALVAQQRFRHKTVKASFQAVFWITVVLNVAGMVGVVRSGTAAELSSVLLGL